MKFQVGIDNNNEGRSIAWALEHPGCFAYGINAEGAALNLESALMKYAGWILRHESNTWLSFAEDEIEIVINGTWDVYYINDDFDKIGEVDGYAVDSFFPYDWKPLAKDEIKHALDMLVWSRDDFLKTLQGLSTTQLDATYPGERWSINGIIGHLGGAEWWYLERLGLAFPRDNVPKDPIERIEKVRKHLVAVLPKLEGLKKVVAVDGEFWSPRKLLRRTLWHEKDHTEHIRKLAAGEN
jgi:hypothetical protein